MFLVIFVLFAKCSYCFAYWMPSKHLMNIKNIVASETEICNLDLASRKTHCPAMRSMKASNCQSPSAFEPRSSFSREASQ